MSKVADVLNASTAQPRHGGRRPVFDTLDDDDRQAVINLRRRGLSIDAIRAELAGAGFVVSRNPIRDFLIDCGEY